MFIYPIKALGGVCVNQAQIVSTGLQHDRRWMLIDSNNCFISQRTHAQLALLQVSLAADHLIVSHKHQQLAPLHIALTEQTTKVIHVQIWEDNCAALEVSTWANEWFSAFLQFPVRLVYMPDTTHRMVDEDDTSNNHQVGFADAFPLLIIGEESLHDLNRRLQVPVLMDRFRPNLVFAGGTAFCEDNFEKFTLSGVTLIAAKRCVRCQVITIDQSTTLKSKEPMKTLAGYRAINKKVLFGQNLLADTTGIIKTGDPLIFNN